MCLAGLLKPTLERRQLPPKALLASEAHACSRASTGRSLVGSGKCALAKFDIFRGVPVHVLNRSRANLRAGVLFAAFVIWPPLAMPESDRMVWAEEVQFATGATALPAEERTKILSMLSEAQAKSACLDYVIAQGSAVEVLEGARKPARHLAMERAQYVAGIVRKAGIPSARIFPNIPPAVFTECSKHLGACVHLEIQGRRPGSTCQEF